MQYNQSADQSQNLVQAKEGPLAELTGNTAENYLKNMVVNLVHKGAGAEVLEFSLAALTSHIFFKVWADHGAVPYDASAPRPSSFFEINPNVRLTEERAKSFNEELDYRLKMLKNIFGLIMPMALSPEIFDAEMLEIFRDRGFKIANEPTEEHAYRVILRGSKKYTIEPIEIYVGN